MSAKTDRYRIGVTCPICEQPRTQHDDGCGYEGSLSAFLADAGRDADEVRVNARALRDQLLHTPLLARLSRLMYGRGR